MPSSKEVFILPEQITTLMVLCLASQCLRLAWERYPGNAAHLEEGLHAIVLHLFIHDACGKLQKELGPATEIEIGPELFTRKSRIPPKMLSLFPKGLGPPKQPCHDNNKPFPPSLETLSFCGHFRNKKMCEMRMRAPLYIQVVGVEGTCLLGLMSRHVGRPW